jgi:hypothetical protein
LERGEWIEGSQKDGQRIQDTAPIGGKEGSSQKLPGVQEGQRKIAIRPEGLGAKGQMKSDPIARSKKAVIEKRLDIGEEREESEDDKS